MQAAWQCGRVTVRAVGGRVLPHAAMGLLTNNDSATVLEVENSEFAYNQRPDGHDHNLYVGRIARLSVTGSYLHYAQIGHLLRRGPR